MQLYCTMPQFCFWLRNTYKKRLKFNKKMAPAAVEVSPTKSNGKQRMRRSPSQSDNSDNEGEGSGTLQINNSNVVNTAVPMKAFSSDQEKHPVFGPKYQEISLKQLEADDAMEMKLGTKYIDLLLVRIISPNKKEGHSLASTFKKPKGTVETKVSYERMYLFKIHTTKNVTQNKRLVYMFLSKTINENLWAKCIQFRDNGKLTVGNFIRVPSPMPIENYMNGDIPMLYSYNPVYLLKAPNVMTSIAVDKSIIGNNSAGFVYTKVTANSLHQFVKQTTCSGCHCDRQRISEWLTTKGCGCFIHGSTKTSMVIGHYLKVDISTSEQIIMKTFTSLKFNELFMSGDVPFSSTIDSLQDTNSFANMSDAMENCLEHINSHGGFTIYGWYKRGEVNDKTMVEAVNKGSMTGLEKKQEIEDSKTLNSEIKPHIVHIKPTNPDYYNPGHQMYRELETLKYDITTIDDDVSN